MKKNNRVFINISIVVLVGLLGFSCSSVKHSQWHNPQAKEAAKEPSAKKYSYDNTAGMMYRIANSRDSLYIDLKFPGKLTRMKVLGFGFTVWIDPEAKNNKRIGIKYPLGNRKQLPGLGNPLRQAEIEEGEHGMLQIDYSRDKNEEPLPKLINKEMKLIGFLGPESVMKQSALNSEIRTNLKYESDRTLAYQLAIPLKKISEAMNIGSDSIVSIGFVTGHMDSQERREKRQTPGVGGGGGMPPMGGAPPAYSGNQMMRGKKKPFAEPASLWLKKVKLASGDED